ncbi:MAG TPA: ABC transporter ATP-binding protein, partial [Candidatus Hydrogenedentes bacterium]|nr:ABC transporter ATP-binding protein [Candidatus Hydrogenedentota bacterium]
LELRILRGLDFDVQKGEILAISGSSGAGKSTLLHIMGTLDAPTAGELFYNGELVSGMSKSKVNSLRNEDIGFVFQFYHLLAEFTAVENVMMPGISQGMPRKECLARAEELLTKVGLTERMTHKPGKLSGGEQQRVAIARALYNNPSVVLADEPTGNLDEETGREIVDLIWELNEVDGVTVVFVTHDLEFARRADRWIHIHEGMSEYRTGE